MSLKCSAGRSLRQPVIFLPQCESNVRSGAISVFTSFKWTSSTIFSIKPFIINTYKKQGKGGPLLVANLFRQPIEKQIARFAGTPLAEILALRNPFLD
jgi:hypothetical protein